MSVIYYLMSCRNTRKTILIPLAMFDVVHLKSLQKTIHPELLTNFLRRIVLKILCLRGEVRQEGRESFSSAKSGRLV